MTKKKIANIYSFMGNYFNRLLEELLGEDGELRARFDFVQGQERIPYDLLFVPALMSDLLEQEVLEFITQSSSSLQVITWDIQEFAPLNHLAKNAMDKKDFSIKVSKLTSAEIKKGLQEFEEKTT